MDDNRAATALEARAIRAYLDTVTQARERQIQDAQLQVDAATNQVDAAAARTEEAHRVYLLAQEEHRRARIQHKDAMAFLELARRPLSDDPHIRRQRGLLHPVRRLPSELLSEIFLDAMASTVDSGTFRPIQVQPYRLALVCRSWRGAALNTKGIWRPMRINFADFDHGSPQLVGLYQLYLDISSQRAGKSGIELFISRLGRASAEVVSGPLCMELVPHLSCLIACRAVRLLSVELPRGLSDFDILSQSTAGLEELRIINTHHGILPLPQQQWAPQLTKVAAPLSHLIQDGLEPFPKVRDVSILPCVLRTPYSFWENQTNARFGLETVFTLFPNADNFVIDLDDAQFITVNQLGHDKMRSLSLASRRGLPALALSYSFPALEEAVLRLQSVGVLEGVSSLLTHAFGSVRRLVLDMEIQLDGPPIGLALFDGLPHLETLSCPRAVATCSFVTALSKAEHWPCPTLSSMSFLRLSPERLVVDSLGPIIAARKAARDAGEAVEVLSVTWNSGRSRISAGDDGGWIFVGGA